MTGLFFFRIKGAGKNRTFSTGCATVMMVLFCMGCGGRSRDTAYGDCYEMGTCECSKREHCPRDQHCINGTCGYLEDAATRLKRFNEPCMDDGECESGFCLGEGPSNGGVCTRICVVDGGGGGDEECPAGWECKPQANREPRDVLLCVQEIESRLCSNCSVDAHCNAIGDLCIQLDDGEFYCGRDCTFDGCPGGYICRDVLRPGWTYTARQCVPEGGVCECTDATVGLEKPCSISNEFGECHGAATCLPGEIWSECDAQVPAREVCDGIDNNCNGLTDAMDPGVDISGLPDDPQYPVCRHGSGGGNCYGIWNCVAGEGDAHYWECSAAEPMPEECNGRDDNCSGMIDDDFVDEQGRYVTVEHCGHCNKDCTVILDDLLVDEFGNVAEGAVECLVRNEQPTCVPILCEPGFYPYPEYEPVRCQELVSSACRPCVDDGDCVVSTDYCILLDSDEASFCHQSCEPDSYYDGCTGTAGVQDCCPDGYLCTQVSGEKLCVPQGGSCRCNFEKLNTTRPCTLIGEGGGGAVCQGLQTCEQTGPDIYEWSECEPSTITVEVCDGTDNNCNGEIDEDFRNEFGFYHTDEHCGECNNNCLARWNQEIQRAIGGCVFRLPATYRCEIVACTEESIPGGGFCRLETDCSSGWSCHPDYHQCLRSCTTAANCDFGQECEDGWCAEPCANNAECAFWAGSGSVCEAGYCRMNYQFHDADGVESNGCECAASVPPGHDLPEIYPVYPEPGWPYVDRDCDGVDGNANAALFVSSESTASHGTILNPYTTIQEALAAYNPNQHPHILVASGTYDGNLKISQGVRMYGGYAPDFSIRDIVLYPTVIRGFEPDHSDSTAAMGTVHIEGVSTLKTVLAGFTIQGYDVNEVPGPGQSGYSSYAIYIKDSGNKLTVANNRIYGGRGGDGSPGRVGPTGASGTDGSPGLNSWECPNSDCQGHTRPGGAGGVNTGCAGGGGNPGATSRSYNTQNPQDYTSTAGGNGLGGQNSIYTHTDPSHLDLCKYDCQVGQGDGDGQNAQNGADGALGAGGSGCGNGFGQISGDIWVASTGSHGTPGARGNGGGGGGAGGSVINYNAQSSCSILNPNGDLGATGGGGGAGGCGGGGGRRGGGGGGSMAVFVVYTDTIASLPDIFGNLLFLGRGGPGGQGGAGGQGGRGGQGGIGGEIVMPAWCAGGGGSGGRGGDGGAGGGAGGGCGGAAYGVAGKSIGIAGYGGKNIFITPEGSGGGSGGPGGPSPAGGGYGGGSGTQGRTADVRNF